MNRLNSIAIIGLGPRGLSVLERILVNCQIEPYRNISFQLNLFDPGLPGAGVHKVDQKEHMLLNTPVELPTLFPGDIFEDTNLANHGLSFYEWLIQIRYPDGQRLIRKGDYLPRRLMGEYLNWVYNQITAQLPNNVSIKFYQQKANEVKKKEGRYNISVANGSEAIVDYVFLTIGHAQDYEDRKKYTAGKVAGDLYPMHTKIPCTRDSKIAINGMGLVALDAISELTIGRGGKFSRNSSGELDYHPSGEEPIIYLYSKSGIPYRARPVSTQHLHYEPVRLNRETVRLIRGSTDRRLCFDEEIMPLMLEEMTIAYFITHIAIFEGEVRAERELKKVERELEKGSLSHWLSAMETKYGLFNPSELIFHDLENTARSSEEYISWFKKYLRADIAESKKGLLASPVKAALEVLLLVREGIREAVNFGGLTNESWKQFFSMIPGLINKNSIGPELARIEELLALINCGTVDISLGPNPLEELGLNSIQLVSPHYSLKCQVDLVCEAYLRSYELTDWSSTVVSSLLGAGLIQGNSNRASGIPGIVVSDSYRVVSPNLTTEEGVWALGIICEGSTYYNNYVPIVSDKKAPSTPFLETQEAVSSMLKVLKYSY
jgi:hypothetical protein